MGGGSVKISEYTKEGPGPPKNGFLGVRGTFGGNPPRPPQTLLQEEGLGGELAISFGLMG